VWKVRGGGLTEEERKRPGLEKVPHAAEVLGEGLDPFLQVEDQVHAGAIGRMPGERRSGGEVP
jgi:hypothetical protein